MLCFSAPSVVRSGDYYLFETDSEEEEEEEEKKEDDPQKKSAFQVTAGFQTSHCLQLEFMIIFLPSEELEKKDQNSKPKHVPRYFHFYFTS